MTWGFPSVKLYFSNYSVTLFIGSERSSLAPHDPHWLFRLLIGSSLAPHAPHALMSKLLTYTIQLSCFAMFLEHLIRLYTSFFDLNIECVMWVCSFWLTCLLMCQLFTYVLVFYTFNFHVLQCFLNSRPILEHMCLLFLSNMCIDVLIIGSSRSSLALQAPHWLLIDSSRSSRFDV